MPFFCSLLKVKDDCRTKIFCLFFSGPASTKAGRPGGWIILHINERKAGISFSSFFNPLMKGEKLSQQCFTLAKEDNRGPAARFIQIQIEPPFVSWWLICKSWPPDKMLLLFLKAASNTVAICRQRMGVHPMYTLRAKGQSNNLHKKSIEANKRSLWKSSRCMHSPATGLL